jgi:hypothetical protein
MTSDMLEAMRDLREELMMDDLEEKENEEKQKRQELGASVEKSVEKKPLAGCVLF